MFKITNNIRKIYSQEFKVSAVKLVFEGKQTVPEAAKNWNWGK
ncbi:MAG: transposase [Methylococcales bacterium]|nr:transposase [Methylococcales bacterium]